ncbi:TonB family protein [Nannocystaceae bacterium ST9]
MSHASFAHVLDADASSSRSSRLLVAGVIACSTVAVAAAFALTLERMSILRVSGPKTHFDLAAVAVVEPPKVEPAPKPEQLAAEGREDGDDMPSLDRRETTPAIVEAGDDAASDELGQPSLGAGKIPGGPPGVGLACPGGICGKGPIGIPGGGGTCVGPACKKTPLTSAPPPKPMPLKSLGCIACADPAQSALRTAAGMRELAGTNVTRFCVDANGRVEAGSVATERSHGDPEIDRVCRDAVKKWRFSPTTVDGVARRACSEATFEIRFE